jgi:hypothetical protein
MIKCQDYSSMPRLGYYTVGDKNFYYKQSAFLESSRIKQPATWDFAHDVFAAAAAKPRAHLPLKTWYKLRAQQLRDQSDYVVLAYSGGADSDAILKAFIDNNIKLDEVWTDQPFAFTEKSSYVPNRSIESSNIISEWFYVIKPELDKLSKTNPETKIHCSDSFTDFGDKKFELQNQLSFGTSYQSVCRYPYIDRYMQELKNKHPRATLIIGIDKLLPVINKKQIGFGFFDTATFFKEDYVDYFFWSPSMPELVVEQAHHVWDYLRNNLRPIIIRDHAVSQTYENGANRAINMDRVIKQLIYPDWDFAKHQVNKTASFFENDQYDSVIIPFQREKFYQATVSNSKNIITQYDPTFVFERTPKNRVDMIKFKNAHMIGTLD